MCGILSVQRREKRSKVPCYKVVELYNSGIGEVDVMGRRTAAFHLDQKSSVRFYLLIFFDLMNIVCFNNYLIYKMKHLNKLFPLDYKIVVTKNLIQYHVDRKRIVPMLKPSKRKKQPELIDNHGGYLPNLQAIQKRCMYCAMEGKENRTFIICLACNIPLCLVKKKNCFQKYHI